MNRNHRIPRTPAPTGCAPSPPRPPPPTRDHAAVWLDDQGGVWADYPPGDDVLPMVWARDGRPFSRQELEALGCTLTPIAHCLVEPLCTYDMRPEDRGAAKYTTVWLDNESEVWADYPTPGPEENQLRPLVWASEQAKPRSDLEDWHGYAFTRIR